MYGFLQVAVNTSSLSFGVLAVLGKEWLANSTPYHWWLSFHWRFQWWGTVEQCNVVGCYGSVVQTLDFRVQCSITNVKQPFCELLFFVSCSHILDQVRCFHKCPQRRVLQGCFNNGNSSGMLHHWEDLEKSPPRTMTFPPKGWSLFLRPRSSTSMAWSAPTGIMLACPWSWGAYRVYKLTMYGNNDPVKFTLRDPRTSPFRDLYRAQYTLVQIRTQRMLHGGSVVGTLQRQTLHGNSDATTTRW